MLGLGLAGLDLHVLLLLGSWGTKAAKGTPQGGISCEHCGIERPVGRRSMVAAQTARVGALWSCCMWAVDKRDEMGWALKSTTARRLAGCAGVVHTMTIMHLTTPPLGC